MPEADTSHDRVLVALSGGVDSSLAAALLLEQGYQVAGVTMRLWGDLEAPDRRATPCCSQASTQIAEEVCQRLGVPHHVVDLRREFRQCVVQRFIAEYAQGRTPNPCLSCNRWIKFYHLLAHARSLGYWYLATGHYARISCTEEAGRPIYHLLKGVDRGKDQSYVLYMLGQEELQHLLLPLGELTKEQARRLAAQRGLPTAGRPESQEICFIPDKDYRRFLAEQLPQAICPGPIRDQHGHHLGIHRGLPCYTIGQRRGLGLAGHPHPLFVVAMDPAENTLIVGPHEALFRPALEAQDVTFVAGTWPGDPLRVEAKVRYRTPSAPAWVYPLEKGRVGVEFDEPQWAITPGQGVVFYQRDQVLGGGTITCASQRSGKRPPGHGRGRATPWPAPERGGR